MTTKNVKVYTRSARHSHAGKETHGRGDPRNFRANDHDDCLWHPECFAKAAMRGDNRVCKDDCDRYTQIRPQPSLGGPCLQEHSVNG